MHSFLSKTVEGKQFELTLDTQIFPKDIILKAAYNFLDKGYFFFAHDTDNNIILQFSPKPDISTPPEEIIWEFSDSLLETLLRDKLEKDNKIIRETIVQKAINGPIDPDNFVTLDTDAGEKVGWNATQNEIDFDKDIDEILKEIENDPDLKIDEQEIENILKEIEQETSSDIMKPKLSLNPEGLKNAKDIFKK